MVARRSPAGRQRWRSCTCAANSPRPASAVGQRDDDCDARRRSGSTRRCTRRRPRAAPLPILLLRTPYGTGDLNAARIAASLPELTAEGFIVVVQDIRGRFKSEGTFVMLRQPRERKDAKAIDESTDTYDTIEWLLANVPEHNGRVGMAGTSYGAWLTVMGMLDPHPALKAVVSQASPADMWLGDDFHHNGSFRLSYGFEYAYRMESSKEIDQSSGAHRHLRHLRVVSEARTAGERQRQVLPRQAPDLERLRQSSGLRRVLEAAGVRAVADAGDRADAERGRLVGPGRLLRSAEDLRAAREARFARTRTSWSSDRGITAAGREATGDARPHRFRQRRRRRTIARTCWPRSSRTTSRARAARP